MENVHLQALEVVGDGQSRGAVPGASADGFAGVVSGWVDTNGDPHEKTLVDFGLINIDEVWERVVRVLSLLLGISILCYNWRRRLFTSLEVHMSSSLLTTDWVFVL